MKKNVSLILILFSIITSYSQINIAVDCSVGPETVNYCYGNNDTTTYVFTSSDGSSLVFTVNSGEVESGWDELIVYDSDGTTDLNAATPYGAGGDVSGITYQSTGDTISFTIQSDGSVNCGSSGFTPIDVTVSCATCTNPTANYSVVSNCSVGPEFFIDTDITNLGSASSLTIQDNQGNSQSGISTTGIVQLGPYSNGTSVIISILNDDDVNCSISSSPLTQDICLDNIVDCSAGSLDFNYCYEANDTNVFSFTTTTGFPVTITFNQGEVEDGWDEFIVYDTDGTELTPANYYGNAGDLTGLTYTSTGDTLSFTIQSDGSVSCDSGSQTPINATIICQTCTAPTVTFTPSGDCALNPDAPEFFIDVEIIDMGSVSTIQIVDDQGSAGQLPTTPGVFTFGPYAAGTNVIMEVSTEDVNCIEYSDPLTVNCPAPPNECSIIFAGPDATFDCDNNTVDLTASYHVTGQDFNVYEINALSSCPTPPTTGGTPTSLDIDDTWSEVVDLEFDFCFFGGVYNQIVIGSNGVASFDTSLAGGYNDWGFSDLLPNNTDTALSEPNIFAGLHDIDPGVCGDINYSVLGSAPSRQFVINFSDVCQFSCGTLQSTMQIILYETSNVIDINIFDKPTCSTWNSGNAVIGIQNPASDIAFTPPGRNTGNWTATNEFYRFSPGVSAMPDYVFEWYENGIFIGNTDTITVTPTEATTYTASITYSQCTGGTITVTDTVLVEPDPLTLDDSSFTITPNCDGATVIIDGEIGGQFAFNPMPTDSATINATTGEVINGTSGAAYTITYTVNPTDICGSTTTQTFNVLDGVTIQTPLIGLEACNNGMTATVFDLTSLETEILNGLTGVITTYHNSLVDAQNAISPIGLPTSYSSNATETIYVRVENSTTGCFETTQFMVSTFIQPSTTIDLSVPYEVCPNATNPITITAIAENYNLSEVDIKWYFEGSEIIGQSGLDLPTVLEAGNYEIEVTNLTTSCSSIEAITVIELVSCVFPQGISPNNDGLNDSFDLSSFDVQSLEIFNRNGTQVYIKNNGYTDQWYGQSKKGDNLPVGTYYFIAKSRDGNVKASWVYINR